MHYPALAIDWPLSAAPVLSAKDQCGVAFDSLRAGEVA